VALLAAVVISRGSWAVVIGLALGGAASLAAFTFKVWLLRRLAANPASAGRFPFLDFGRYLIMAAILSPAIWLAMQGEKTYVIAALATLPLAQVASLLQGLWDARAARPPSTGGKE
jgi:hypothetical protein